MKQLECEVAQLQQKLSRFSCYSYVPKPINPTEKADFKAAKFDVDEAKLKTIESVNKENQDYLASNKCCDLLDGLLSINCDAQLRSKAATNK